VSTVERLNIRAALGRVLAEDVISPVNVPQHDNSAMDGYAVRFADLRPDADSTLTVIGTAYAGKPFTGTVRPGQAVRTMTGAVIASGADTVIQQERAKATGNQVAVMPVPKKGMNTRSAGEDLRAGQGSGFLREVRIEDAATSSAQVLGSGLQVRHRRAEAVLHRTEVGADGTASRRNTLYLAVPAGASGARSTSSKYQPLRAGIGLAATKPTSLLSLSRATNNFLRSTQANGSSDNNQPKLATARRDFNQVKQSSAVSRRNALSKSSTSCTETPARVALLMPASSRERTPPRTTMCWSQRH